MTAPFDHLGQGRPDRSPHAEQVHLDHPLERDRVDAGDRGWRIDGDARVGEHHIDAAEALHRLGAAASSWSGRVTSTPIPTARSLPRRAAWSSTADGWRSHSTTFA